MTVGIICDGSAEVEVLTQLLPKFNRPGLTFGRVAYADMQPLAPVMQIVRAASTRVPILQARGATRVVVLLDREDLQECPGVRAANVKAAFIASGLQIVEVVVKDRRLENWLIADANSVNSLNSFNIPDGIIDRICRAGSDSIPDAVRSLSLYSKNGYSKRRDAIQIARIAKPDLVEANSRSVRRLLRVCGDSRYVNQSRIVAI